MKKILIPVDFSDTSLNAMEYGLQFAEELGSSVTLLYVYEGHQTGNVIMSIRQTIEKEAQTEMSSVYNKAKKIAPTVVLNELFARGQAAYQIAETAKEDNYDLIVMGTSGASGLKEIFIGSITNEVIKETEVPTIIVPAGCTYRSFKTVILSLSNDLIKDAKVISPLTDLLKRTDAELEVYHFGRIEEKPEDLAENLDILEAVADCSVTYAYGTDKQDVNERIRAFAEEKQADLIGLIRQERNFWAKIFDKSVTSKQAFQSTIPLLILQNK